VITMSMLTTVAAEPSLYIELAAVFLGGLSGSIFAVQRHFAVTGELALGIASALGGGMLRDVMLGRMPVALTHPQYLPIACVAALIGFAFGSVVMRRLQLILDVLDPVWMGLFAVIGAEAALDAGTTVIGAVFVGCVTAVGGGVLRDLLAGEIPQLVLPGPINYLAGIAGSVVFTVAITATPIERSPAVWGTIALVVGLRLVALRFGVMAPVPPNLSRLAAARPGVRRRRR
jgi:uncharacterized membrane protein YeiH